VRDVVLLRVTFKE